jgi:drug/metabolite transporter (DMT)-like permease
MGVAYLSLLRIRTGRILDRDNWRFGRSGVAFAGFHAIGSVMFVSSLRTTSIAHTLLISATVPAITAGLSRLAHHERIPRKTLLAAGGVLVGIAGLVVSSPGTSALMGDLEALGGAVALAAGLLVAPRDARLPAAQALGAAFVAAIAVPFAHLSTLHAHDLAIAAPGFLILIPCGSSLMWGGRRHLTAAELSLLLMTESVFGPIWGWIGLNQRPSWQTVAAGAIILTSVGAHTLTFSDEPDNPILT